MTTPELIDGDPIGTVRRGEDHDGGYSVWALIPLPGLPISLPQPPIWLCVQSTSPGMLGLRVQDAELEQFLDVTSVIGTVPGTPAAEAGSALTREQVWQVIAGIPSAHPAAIIDALAGRGVLRLAPTRESAR